MIHRFNEMGMASLDPQKLWGVVRAKKGIDNSLAAIKSCRAARPDGEMST